MDAAIPYIEFTNNNRGGLDIRCENYIFQVKTTGKKAALYRCPTKKPNQCFASISLKTCLPEGSDSPEVIQPFQVTNLNLNHVEGCNPKPNDFFEERSFIKNVKETVTKNPLIPPQQLYEQERSKVNTNALLAGVEAPILPDYLDRKGRFIRHRNKDVNKNASSLIELIVPEVKTKYGEPFLIHDNKKKNRILVFASPIGLKILSESKRWHSDGTFHTKSKYFGQLYTIHAYFPPSKYDEKVDSLHQKNFYYKNIFQLI